MTTAAPGPARVVVTGSTGFIGAHVLRSLLALGARVTAAYRGEAKLHAQDWHQRVTPLCIDLEAATPEQLDRLAGHDCVAHLAWGHLNDFRSEAHILEELPRHLRYTVKVDVVLKETPDGLVTEPLDADEEPGGGDDGEEEKE